MAHDSTDAKPDSAARGVEGLLEAAMNWYEQVNISLFSKIESPNTASLTRHGYAVLLVLLNLAVISTCTGAVIAVVGLVLYSLVISIAWGLAKVQGPKLALASSEILVGSLCMAVYQWRVWTAGDDALPRLVVSHQQLCKLLGKADEVKGARMAWNYTKLYLVSALIVLLIVGVSSASSYLGDSTWVFLVKLGILLAIFYIDVVLLVFKFGRFLVTIAEEEKVTAIPALKACLASELV